MQAAQFEPFLPNGTAGMLAAIPLLIGLFFGIEAAKFFAPFQSALAAAAEKASADGLTNLPALFSSWVVIRLFDAA